MALAVSGGVGVLLFTDVTLAGITAQRRLANLRRFVGELGPPSSVSVGDWLASVSVLDLSLIHI